MTGAKGMFMRRDYKPADTTWRERGACRNADDTLFYHPADERASSRRARADAAKAICRACPVQLVCREQSLASREPYGTWGGLSEDERAMLLDGKPIEGPLVDHPRPRRIPNRTVEPDPDLVLTRPEIPRSTMGLQIKSTHVVAHVQSLVQAGYTPSRIARVAGLTSGVVVGVASGNSHITERTEALLLAVQPVEIAVAA